MSCRSQKSHLPTQQVLHFPSPALLQPQCSPWRGSRTTRESLPYQNLRVCCSLWNPLLPDILRLTPQCLQVCIKLSPYLWSSPWPHPAPHGISCFSYSTSFPPPPHIYHHLICYTFIYYFYHLFLTLECKLHEGRDLVPFTDVSTVPRTVPNTR